jgi:hypothetical protein
LHTLAWGFVPISIQAFTSNIANMQESYVIVWTAKAKDRSGVGKKYFTKDEAQSLASELNDTYPDFRHHAIDTVSEEPAKALVDLQESLSRLTGRAVPFPEFASQQARAAEVLTVDPDVAAASNISCSLPEIKLQQPTESIASDDVTRISGRLDRPRREPGSDSSSPAGFEFKPGLVGGAFEP